MLKYLAELRITEITGKNDKRETFYIRTISDLLHFSEMNESKKEMEWNKVIPDLKRTI
jgi:hypothetical protein